jgi:2'-5' RNA ligase
MTTGQQMYLAVGPPPEVIDTIDSLPTRAQRGVRYTRRERWHITVRFLGEADPEAALAALGDLDASAANVVLGPEVSLLGPRVLIIPAAGLEELAADSATAFDGIGEPLDREFNGHLTLARLKGAPLRDPSMISVLGAPISATFLATSLMLFETGSTPEGATHTVIAEKPLSE